MSALGERLDGPIMGTSVTTSKTEKRIEYVDYGDAGILRVHVIPYYCIDGDEQLKILKSKQKHNIPLGVYDTWFLSMGMKTKFKMKDHEMLMEIVKLGNRCIINEKIKFESKLSNAIDCMDNIPEKYQDAIMEEIEMECNLTKHAMEAMKKDGRKEERETIAKNMQEMNIDTQTITEATGLTEKEIMNL